MEKIPAGSFGQRHNVQVCVSLSPGFTKASNRVENLLEARGLGLQLFFEGLSGERMAVLTTLPLFVLCSVPLSDGLSQKPEPPQLDPAKPGLGWAVCLLSVSLDTSQTPGLLSPLLQQHAMNRSAFPQKQHSQIYIFLKKSLRKSKLFQPCEPQWTEKPRARKDEVHWLCRAIM